MLKTSMCFADIKFTTMEYLNIQETFDANVNSLFSGYYLTPWT